MKKIFSFICLFFSLSLAYSQKTINDANAEKRDLSGFHAIEVSGGVDLYLSQGEETVVISASKIEYREQILTKVENGVLKIWIDWKNNFKMDWGNRKLRAYVSLNNLDLLHASGGSDVSVDGVLKLSKMDLHVSGGSDFSGKVSISDLSVEASGGSDVIISGVADKLYIHSSGGSDFKGYDLAADFCKVEASGGSDVFITVNKELSANANGGSDIHYKGSGLIRDIKSSGGNVKKVSK